MLPVAKPVGRWHLSEFQSTSHVTLVILMAGFWLSKCKYLNLKGSNSCISAIQVTFRVSFEHVFCNQSILGVAKKAEFLSTAFSATNETGLRTGTVQQLNKMLPCF